MLLLINSNHFPYKLHILTFIRIINLIMLLFKLIKFNKEQL